MPRPDSRRRCRAAWCRPWLVLWALAVLTAVPGAAAAVDFGPRLRGLVATGVPAAPRIAPPLTTPTERLRLIALGPEREAFAARLARHGLAARTIGPVLRLDVPAGALAQLAGDERVTVTLGARLRPLLDRSLPAIGLTHALQSERGGRDVLVAILDTGIDFEHPDFLNDDGSTRIVAYWDQTAEAENPEQFGIVCDALDINRGDCPNNADEQVAGFLPNGHGTHVAGIAAGSDERFTGVAPEALIVGVRLDFEEAGLIDALAWVDEVAKLYGKAAVINLSLGANEGPHDGSAPSEQVIDDISGPGRIVVAAAGNEGPGASEQFIHTGGPLGGAEARARFKLSPVSSVDAFHAHVWATADSNVRVGLAIEEDVAGIGEVLAETPAWDPTALPDDGETFALRVDGDVAARVTALPVETTAGDPGVVLEIARADESLGRYVWQLYWSGATGVVDAWLTDRVAYFEPTTGPQPVTFPDGSTAVVPFVAGDARKTITLPGAARKALTISGFVTRNQWVNLEGQGFASENELGSLLNIASRGPTRDGRLKPDLSAPGEFIASSLATTVQFAAESLQLDEAHVLQRGTSMAAPHIAGVAALLLEGDPQLGPDEILAALAAHAVSDTQTGPVPNANWGAGKLSLAGLDADAIWQSGARDRRPPAIAEATASRRDGRIVLQWTTDELARASVEYPDGRRVLGPRSYATRHEQRLPSGAPDRLRAVAIDPAGNETVAEAIDVPDGGCGCAVPGSPGGAPWLPLVGAVAIWFGLRHSKPRTHRNSRSHG